MVLPFSVRPIFPPVAIPMTVFFKDLPCELKTGMSTHTFFNKIFMIKANKQCDFYICQKI